MSTTQDRQAIQAFLEGDGFAVVGASNDRNKYGNRVLRAYLDRGLTAWPVNPNAEEVEGLTCHPTLADLASSLDRVVDDIHGVSIITPPNVTAEIIDQAIELGVKRVWTQPGAEHDEAMRRAENAGLDVIGHGPCVLVELGSHEARA